METKNKLNSIPVVGVLILAASLTRLIHHPYNFTAIGAMALFSGAVISDRKLAYFLPVAAMLLTDLLIGFHASLLPVYACFAFTVALGMLLRRKSNWYFIGGLSLLSSTVFFLVTNLPFWYADISLYPITWQGTIQSYTMGLPFFKNQIAGDLFFNALLFGTFSLYSRQTSSMQFNQERIKK